MNNSVISGDKEARKFIFNLLSSLFKIPFSAQMNLENNLNKECILFCMDEENKNDLSKWKVVYTGLFEMIDGNITISYIIYLDKPDIMHVSIDGIILIINKQIFDNNPEKVFKEITDFISNHF